MRLLCVWLERLLTDSLVAKDPALAERPCVAVEAHKGAMLVIGVSARAEAQGVVKGVSLADARAKVRDLVAREVDASSVGAVYERAVKLASRYGPWVSEPSAMPSDKLVLEVTGCAHLFGGEGPMLEELRRRGLAEGVRLRLAIADRLIGAIALAEFGPSETSIAPSGDTWAAMQPLPVVSLGLDETTRNAFARLGIKRVSDLSDMPASSLRARFGASVVQAIERAKGLRPDPVAMRPHKPPPRVRIELAEPARSPQEVEGHVQRLVQALCDRLATQRLGAERMLLTLGESRNGRQGYRRISVGVASPMRDATRWMRLIGLREAVFDPADGVESVEIRALVAPLQVEQSAIHGEKTQNVMDQLVEQLSVSIGEDKLTRFVQGDSHLPEKAWLRVPALNAKIAKPASTPSRLRRPLTIFARPRRIEMQADSRPVQMHWRGETHKIRRASGPERIVPPWWEAEDLEEKPARDYWRIETKRGVRLWVYQSREQPRNWYLHGRFA